MNLVIEYVIRIVAIMFVLITSRVFQAYIALLLGDDGPQREGAISLNPINHIDLSGFICFVIFKFGWGKPLNVNINRFKNKFWGKIIFSLANATICFVYALLGYVLYVSRIIDNSYLLEFIMTIASISIAFGIIGLIPLPPFDGAIFISAFLPSDVEYEYFKLSKFTTIILLVLIITQAFEKLFVPVLLSVHQLILKLAIFLVA